MRGRWRIGTLQGRCVAGECFFSSFGGRKGLGGDGLIISLLCVPRHATGGSIPNVLPQLSPQELNVTKSIGQTGNVSPSRSETYIHTVYTLSFEERFLPNVISLTQMFEKFSISDVDSAGQGGEYTVQVRILIFPAISPIFFSVPLLCILTRTMASNRLGSAGRTASFSGSRAYTAKSSSLQTAPTSSRKPTPRPPRAAAAVRTGPSADALRPPRS